MRNNARIKKSKSDIGVNGQRFGSKIQTVHCIENGDRLVHRWVSEMMLNVQSGILHIKCVSRLQCF
jgi:hypothetical protein